MGLPNKKRQFKEKHTSLTSVFKNKKHVGGILTNLVGGWTNPSEKYAHQNGFIFPKFGSVAPRKINMEHNHGGLEDHFPF